MLLLNIYHDHLFDPFGLPYQMSSIGTSTSRRRISSLALGHAFDTDVVCVIDHDNYIYITRGIGPTFAFPTLFVVGQVFTTSIDCGSVLSKLLSEMAIGNKMIISVGNLPKTSMTKQAEMFLNMIVELVEQNPEDSASLLPSIHALHHCMRTGWQPTSIPQVTCCC